MNETHKELISIALTLSIVIFALYIIHRFIPCLLWAGIITIATWPLYKRWQGFFRNYRNLSAFLFTTLLSLLLLVPLSWLITVLVKEIQIFVNYLQLLNREGGKVPAFIPQLPFGGADLATYWNNNLAHPGNIKTLLTSLHLSLTPISYYAKQVGLNIAHRSIQLGFTLLSLFFFYRDGNALIKQINRVGEFCLGQRWFRYADQLPSALRSTVNGTIVVGLAVGLLMGFAYALVHFPAPTLTGFITAMAAMIPFVVPVVFLVVAIILVAKGSMVYALIILGWGTLVMFIADHFVKPVLIGGAIKLPFLAVLFGILGGVETLGISGLFLGPIVLVLFVTLWQELNQLHAEKFNRLA